MPTLPPYKGNYNVGFIDVETISTSIKPGLLARIFYPSNQRATYSPWLPDRWKYAKGYGQYLHLPLIIIAIILYPILSFTFTKSTAKLAPANDQKKFPVVIFSHGLGGMRTTYSQLCGNLASRGFIVASIEHGDGSACFTSRMGGMFEIPYYHHCKEKLLGILQRQVNQRRDEVHDCVTSMKKLNDGNFDDFLDEDPIYEDFYRKFDFDNLVLVGHSFGAATSISVLSNANVEFRCAVLLDPWMYALTEDLKLTVPTLNMQSNFFHWPENLDAIKKMVYNQSYSPKSLFGYFKNTRHQGPSDLGLMFPWVMTKANLAGPLEPAITHSAQDQLIYDFVKKHVNVIPEASEGAFFNYGNHCVFSEQAFTDLYDAMEKIAP